MPTSLCTRGSRLGVMKYPFGRGRSRDDDGRRAGRSPIKGYVPQARPLLRAWTNVNGLKDADIRVVFGIMVNEGRPGGVGHALRTSA